MPFNSTYEDPSGELDYFDDETVKSFETPLLPE